MSLHKPCGSIFPVDLQPTFDDRLTRHRLSNVAPSSCDVPSARFFHRGNRAVVMGLGAVFAEQIQRQHHPDQPACFAVYSSRSGA